MFKDSPLELTVKTIKYLSPRNLFTLAQTNKFYCDLAHEELFSRSANIKNQIAQHRLVRYWCSNPDTLLKKSIAMRQSLIKKLREYLEINTHLTSIETVESFYLCLTLLSVADNNIDQFQENFIRLSLVSDFEIPVLLSALGKSILMLRNDQNDSGWHDDRFNGINRSDDYKELVIELIRNDAPIGSSITTEFIQALIEDLEKSSSVEDLTKEVKTCGLIFEILTSEEAFNITKILLNKFFDFSFYTNPLQEDDDKPFEALDYEIKSLLKELSSKLSSDDVDQVYKILFRIFDEYDKKNYPPKMSMKIYYVLQAFVERFSAEQKSQCFDFLLKNSEPSYRMVNDLEEPVVFSLITILEQDKPDAFLTKFVSLIDFFYSTTSAETLTKFNTEIEKDYNLALSSLKKMQQEFLPPQVKQEFILFLKLLPKIKNGSSSLVETVCDKLLKTTCQLITRLLLIFSIKKNDNKCFPIIIALNRKNISEFVNACLLDPKIPKGLVQQGLINLTMQNLSLEKIHVSSKQADEYLGDFLKLHEIRIDQSPILLYLARLISKDLAYKLLEKVIDEPRNGLKFIESLISAITIEQIEELVLKLIEKFQITPESSLKEHNFFGEFLLRLLVKLPEKVAAKIYLPKLLAIQNITTIKYVLLTRFPACLGNDVIKKLVSECLTEIKKDVGYIFAKDLANWFTEAQVLEYYEYVLTCLSSKEDLKTSHNYLVKALMKKLTSQQLIKIFDSLNGNESNFILQTVIEEVFLEILPQIDIKNLRPLYLVLQKKVEEDGKIRDKTVYFVEHYFLVKQYYTAVCNFMSAPSLSSDDSGVLKPK